MEFEDPRPVVLVVDDEPLNLTLIRTMLDPMGLEVVLCEDGRQAQAAMAERTFDLLVFDIMMPEIDGLALTRGVAADPKHKDVPILILTSLAGQQTLAAAFEAGATDFLTKPFHGTELVYRIRSHLRMRSLQKRLEAFANELNLQVLKAMRAEDELRQSQAALAEANRTLAEWAHHDALTGLWNRRKAWDLMEYESDRSRRRSRTIGVAIVDIDRFKDVNDQMGHDVGDLVLRQTAGILGRTVRRGDIVARWGGEEFLVVFPETDGPGALAAAEKLRQAVADAAEGQGPPVTVSVGVALKDPQADWEPVLKAADLALYQAKEAGRNRVVAG